jgi:hypothetical protein
MSQNDSGRNIIKVQANESSSTLINQRKKILVIVKAAPNISSKYRETVCTIGVTEAGEFIRMYPISFRYLPWSQRFKKYQWININLSDRDEKKDNRKESYTPDTSSIELLEELNTKKGWEKRKEIIIPLVSKSVEDLEDMYDKDKTSIGIIKPKTIDFKVEKGIDEWGPKQLIRLNQLGLFESPPKNLEKIPYTFSYLFTCDDIRCKRQHKFQIIDWEIYELFRKMRDSHGSVLTALEKVKDTWLNRMWSENRDSYLLLGTIFPFKSYNVLGVFWPPKEMESHILDNRELIGLYERK